MPDLSEYIQVILEWCICKGKLFRELRVLELYHRLLIIFPYVQRLTFPFSKRFELTALVTIFLLILLDAMTGELVYQWLMILDSDTPTITKKHEITVKCNHSSVQCLEFSNRLNLKTVYEFQSSRPDLLQPKSEALTFEPRESKLVDLFFHPQPKYGTCELHLYANDIDYNVVETYLLKITYLP